MTDLYFKSDMIFWIFPNFKAQFEYQTAGSSGPLSSGQNRGIQNCVPFLTNQ